MRIDYRMSSSSARFRRKCVSFTNATTRNAVILVICGWALTGTTTATPLRKVVSSASIAGRQSVKEATRSKRTPGRKTVSAESAGTMPGGVGEQWVSNRAPHDHAILQGVWQNCDGERVYEHRLNGVLLWEFHMAEDFGLYAFRVADGDHDHKGPLNLLSAPVADSLETWRGARQWNVPSLKLWISVVRAGESQNCDSFYVRIETKP